MGRRSGGEMSSELVRTREQFEVWRAGRTRGDRIPAKLWKQAVKLAGRHGVSHISSALKLDYYTLKNRLEQSGNAVEDDSPETAFLELPSSCVLPAACEYSIEVQDGRGASLRVTVKGGGIPDLIALGRSFWDAR